MKHKIYRDVDAIIADVSDGARIMFGGFGGAGFPNNLIQALARRGTKDIVAISNNCGTHDGELGLLFKLDRIRHVIASFPGPHATRRRGIRTARCAVRSRSSSISSSRRAATRR